jgi:hypothetical protein
MTIEHVIISDPYIHEPKGVAAATQDKVYVSDGAGSGSWQGISVTQLDSTGEEHGHIITADGTGGTAWRSLVWKDLLGQITVRGAGANDPAFELITGSTNMWAYSFSAGTMMQFWTAFHIGHDYAPGTVVYPHVHWFNAAAVPNTGNVRWGFEYAVAKGHSQQAFPLTATTTVYKLQASSATRYMHAIGEVAIGDAIPATNLEPDSVIYLRIFRDAADVGDTCTDKVYALMADIHYQADTIGTKNKAPDFNT